MTNTNRRGLRLVLLSTGTMALVLSFLHLSLAPLARMVVSLDETLFPHASAKENLVAWTSLPVRKILLPFKPKRVYYVWSGNVPAYKNERLRAYQDMLRERGITEPDMIRMLVAQLVHENGALAEDTLGDYRCNDGRRGRLKVGHCSFGILQYNTWSHHGVSAEVFLKDNAYWKDWRFQLGQMADMVKARKDLYGGNLKRMVLHHNCPVCARNNADNGYVARIKKQSASILPL